jgi:hypothetical protein
MLYREIIAVCSQIHTKHTSTLCGQKVVLLNVKLGGAYVIHKTLNGKARSTPYIEVVKLVLGK